MDLDLIYSKTAKGLRARASLIGGVSAHMMRVLSFVDGTSKAKSILRKYDLLSETQLVTALSQLEKEGYIKPVVITRPGDDDWALTANFAPMEVEEVLTVEEIEARAKEAARIAEEHKAKIKEETRLQAERKAKEKAEQEQANEKVKAEAKVKALLETERKVKEIEGARQKAEAEEKAKADEKARINAERKAKAEEEARQKAEEKAQAEAQARQGAEAKLAAERKERAALEAKLEAERKAREEAEHARIKAEAETRAKVEQARIAAEQKVKAEAETKLAAERKAREAAEATLEAERKAKVEEDTKKAQAEERRKTELKQKEEAERKANAEAEEKNKEQEKERARQEIARIVREAEEARKKAEAKAKEERQEVLRKSKAEEDAKKAEEKARIKAEQEAKQQAKRGPKTVQAPLKAEAKAKEITIQTQIPIEVAAKPEVSANEKASLLMESFALDIEDKNVAEASRQLEAEATTKRQAKADTDTEFIRAKVDAEEEAKVKARDLANMEMERIASEAELERQKYDAEQQKTTVTRTKPTTELQVSDGANAIEVRWGGDLESDDDEPFDDEEENLVEEENKVKREIEKKNKQGAEAQGREDIKRQAKQEAAIKAQSKNSRKIINYGNWINKLKKVIFLYVPLLLLLLIGLLHVINISPLIAPIEKLASESMGEAVKIGEVHASLWPQPHLVLGNVAIGSSNQNIQAVNVVPDTSTLSETVKRVKLIEIEGLTLGQESFSQPQLWLNRLGKAEHLKVEQIGLKKIAFKLRELELGPFAGKVELDESRQLKSIHLNSADSKLALQITPQSDSADIALTSTNWPLPVNTKVVFDEVKAVGKVSQSLIYFSQFEGKIYGGSFTGKAAIDWSSQWSLAGNFDLSKATLPQLLKVFGSTASIDGKLNLTGIFSYRSDVAVKLTDAPELTASFEVLDGKINGVELVQAVLSKSNKSLVGDATRFDTLTGNVQIKNGRYEYKQLVLNSDQFRASGNVGIAPTQEISGRISADLAAESRRLQTSFDLAGKVGAVQRQ